MAAAGRWKLYDTAKLKIGQGIIDLDTHTFKVILLGSTSNCDTLTHDEYADLTSELTTANGYTNGGQTLTSVTLNNSSGIITFDCADPSWTASGAGITARFAVIYDDTVVGDPLLAVCLLDTAPADVTATAGNPLTIIINASGVFTMSGANVN